MKRRARTSIVKSAMQMTAMPTSNLLFSDQKKDKGESTGRRGERRVATHTHDSHDRPVQRVLHQLLLLLVVGARRGGGETLPPNALRSGRRPRHGALR